MPAPSLSITIDAASSTPPFDQLRAQLATQISNHELVTGTRLPPVRELAATLGLAANTVARAYRELESAGLVETRGRNGTVVGAAGDAARSRLRTAASSYVELARSLGIDDAEAAACVRAAQGR